MQGGEFEYAVRFLVHSGSPRAFSPRDDKREVRVGYGEPVDRHARKGLAMTMLVWVRSVCHCEEDRMDDAAIHRVSGDVDGFVSSLTGSQWIATGFQPSR